VSNFLACTFRWQFVAAGVYNDPSSVQGENWLLMDAMLVLWSVSSSVPSGQLLTNRKNSDILCGHFAPILNL
jgi:hypothetical protein